MRNFYMRILASSLSDYLQGCGTDAVENPFCRLQVLGWAADVLKSCVEVTIPAMAMNITSEDETLLKLLSLPKLN